VIDYVNVELFANKTQDSIHAVLLNYYWLSLREVGEDQGFASNKMKCAGGIHIYIIFHERNDGEPLELEPKGGILQSKFD
jgi:hypothetical protein